MCRSLILITLVFCMACGIAHADVTSDLAEIRAGLPAEKTKLDQLKAAEQDISYPLISYTVLENFPDQIVKFSTGLDAKVAELLIIKADLDQQLAEALAGNRTFPKVPKWTGDTRPIVSGTSLIAPTITQGNSCREIRPVFFIGFLEHSYTPDMILQMQKWSNYGINLIQWEPYNIYHCDPDVKATLDLAYKYGVAVDLLIYALHPTLIQIKNHPALHSLCLANEPKYTPSPTEERTALFRAWLQQRHGSINVLNDCWETSYSSFSDIPMPSLAFGIPSSISKAELYDVCRWNQDNFTNIHKEQADAAHERVPNVPVQYKVQGYSFGCADQVHWGNDPYLYSGVTDINGNDGSNYYKNDDATLKPYFANWLGCYMYGDMQRSMRDATIFNSENHLWNDNHSWSAAPEHIRTALWQEAIHGQSVTACWVWDSGTEWQGSFYEWPLCTRAVGIANYDLNRAAKEVTALQQVPEQVTILHPFSSLVWDSGHNYDYIAMRAYWGLTFCRVRTGFITERQLEAGILPKTSILIVPNAKYITDAAFETLKNYQGHIIYLVDGNLLCYDEYGKPRSEQLANVDAIPFAIADAKSKNFYTALLPKLIADGLTTKYDLVDSSGSSLTWGVEFRETETSDGDLVNVCDYLYDPISVKLTRDSYRCADRRDSNGILQYESV